MSTRQNIIKLLKEGKTVSQIIKELKVSKRYVFAIKSYLKHNKNTFERKSKIKSQTQKLKGKNIVKLTCKICGGIFNIRTNNKNLYTSKIKDNWICGINKKCIKEFLKLKREVGE